MHTTTLARCDDRPDRFDAWLRLAAHAITYALGGQWIRVRLAGLFVFLADAYLRASGGRMSVLMPSRTGGGDHSYRAVVHGSPMVFGGNRAMGVACDDRVRARTSEVYLHHQRRVGWVATRRALEQCFPLVWPATCTAPEGETA